jgi:glycosyltransferase involved in cell wall biosynthesis
MPNWNNGRFIATAIQSVVNQTYVDFELIVVDDGSSDTSPSIVEGLAKTDSRIRVTVNGTRRGASYSRNKGMKEASGRYLCFIDSDDVFKPDRLGKMVEALQKSSDHIAFTDIFTIDENGKLLRDSFLERLPSEGDAYASILTDQKQGQGTMMIPASAPGAVGYFDETMSWGEDFDYLLRLAQAYDVVLIRQPLYGYRRHGTSTSALTHAGSKGEAYIKVLESNLERNWDGLDDATKFRVIRRIQNTARESQMVGKYLGWKISPTYLRLTFDRVMSRLKTNI